MRIKNIYIVLLFLSTMSSYGQSLQEYLNQAEKNSPELQAKQYRYESALEKINEVGSLPNTKFSVGYFFQEVETRVGAQKAKLSASQNLPWFGTLSAKKESATFKAEAIKNEVDLYRRQLFLNVKKSYYELYALKAKRTVLIENRSILDVYKELALSKLENNKATMVDVLKINIEKNELEDKLNTVTENLLVKKSIFNLLLNALEESPISIIDSLIIAENEEVFKKESIVHNPKLTRLNNIQNSLIKSELANKKEGLPNIGLGLDYVFVEDRSDMFLSDNGKDVIMPMVSVSVPLFSKRFSSKQKQLQLEQKAIEISKDEVTNKLYELFEHALARMKNAKATLKTQQKNSIEVSKAEDVLLSAYQTAEIDFTEILEMHQLKLKFQLKEIAATKEYVIQKAIVEFLTTN